MPENLEGKVENGKRIMNRWKNKEDWIDWGLQHKHNERNPTSFYKSKDKEERRWITKGQREKWLKDFEFVKKYELSKWPTKDEWIKHGLRRGYDKLNVTYMIKSKVEDERDWHNKGYREGWTKDFIFKTVVIRGRWSTKEEWLKYGLEHGYSQRNPTSLCRSKNKNERGWINKGQKKGWSKEFPFFEKSARWQKEELEKLYNKLGSVREVAQEL